MSSDPERQVRQLAVGLSYDDPEAMRPVWEALEGSNYPAAISLIVGMVERESVAVHRHGTLILRDASAHFGVDATALDSAWDLPDRWQCSPEEYLFLAEQVIERIGARIDDPLRHIKEMFRCGEWMLALEEFAVVVDREGLELTVVEQTALKMALWYLSPAWFQDLPLRASRSSL